MGRTPMSGGSAFRFLPVEVADMEKALDESSGATPARSIVEALADKFTNSSSNGREVQWKQVWNWFQNRRHAQKAKIDKLKAVGSSIETPPASKPVPVPVPVAGSGTVKKTIDVSMDFEAKSARDGAWYDVSAFITKRDSESGEPEVKVRFAGFGSEEDEWVNIATAIRQRSLPCETTECVAVLPGDLILCFQEGSEQALYFDADILDVQRRRHDVRGCRCRFWVRYRHDQTEEVVPLRKVCRRPETEQRLQLVREVSKLSNKDTAMDRPLNGTPSINTPQLPPTTPATTAMGTQLSTVFNAMHLQGMSPNSYTPVQQGTSTPGLQPMQPIPMQSLATPDAMASIHQQAALPSFALASTTPVQAIASTQGPTLSMPIAAAQGTIIQEFTASVPAQQIPPSIESSISQQLTISAPAEQQSRHASAGVEPSVSQQQSTGVPGNAGVAGTSYLAQPMEIASGVSSTPAVDPIRPADVGLPSGSNVATAPTEDEKPLVSIHLHTTGAAAETSNLTQPKEIVNGVSSTPAVHPIRPADVGLPSGSNVATAPTEGEKSLVSKDLPTIPVDEPTKLGEAAVPSVIAPVSTLPE